MGLLNPGGPIAQFKRNRCSISPVELILQSGVRKMIMSTQKEYLDYILDQLSDVEGIRYRAMMGEYILYLHGRIAAYLCDDRLLVKPVTAARRMLPEAPMEAPYPGAKEMLIVENTDDREFMKLLLNAMYTELPEPKPKKVRMQKLTRKTG